MVSPWHCRRRRDQHGRPRLHPLARSVCASCRSRPRVHLGGLGSGVCAAGPRSSDDAMGEPEADGPRRASAGGARRAASSARRVAARSNPDRWTSRGRDHQLMSWKQVATGAVLAAAVLAPASQVSAHAGLVASVPAANAVLETGPPAIQLVFDEAVDGRLADIELYDQNAKLIPTGTPGAAAAGEATVQASVPTIGNGVYVVVWRVPSDDGHVVDGVFSFQVGTAAGAQSGVDVGALIDKVSGNAAANSTVGRLDTGARLLALIGLIVLVGGGLLAVQSAESSANRMLLWLAWAFLLVGSLGSFGLYGAKVVAGTPSDALKPSVWGKVVGSHTASVLLVRSILVLALAVLLLTFARRARDVWRGAALALSIALILTFATIGHASAQH